MTNDTRVAKVRSRGFSFIHLFCAIPVLAACGTLVADCLVDGGTASCCTDGSGQFDCTAKTTGGTAHWDCAGTAAGPTTVTIVVGADSGEKGKDDQSSSSAGTCIQTDRKCGTKANQCIDSPAPPFSCINAVPDGGDCTGDGTSGS